MENIFSNYVPEGFGEMEDTTNKKFELTKVISQSGDILDFSGIPST
jgi:hypothetical protein